MIEKKRKHKLMVLAETVGAIHELPLHKPQDKRELPEGWEWKTLEEIAEVVGGGTPRTNDPTNFEGGTIPWITPADLSGYTSKKISHGNRYITKKGLSSSSARLLPEGSVLFTSRAPIGYVAIASNPISTNQGFKSFVLKEGILPEYVYWYLKGSKDLAESLASGTTFLELSGAKAKQLPIPLAPIDQQKLIVSEIEKQLSRLDEAVAGLKRIKANLKRYKASVLKAAVEGKLTEEWRLSARERAQVDELESIPKAQAGKWFVYIIECDNESFYVGHTSDLHARWKAHCEGKAADWTHQYPPKYLIHFEELNSQADAVKREKDLKTGYGRTWRKREIAAGRMKPIVHNPENETGLPVHGVQTGSELLKRILAERKKKWEEKNPGKKYKEPVASDTSSLPELPEGWVWSSLGQLAWSVKDGPHYSPKYSETGIPFISGGNVRPEGIDFSTAKYISPELHAELSNRCKPEYGDLLYTKGGTTGIARINTEKREFNVWVHVAVLKLVNLIEKFYVQHALNSAPCYRQSQKYTHGVGNQDLGLTRMVWITIPLPPLEEQIVIIGEIDRRLSIIRETEHEVEVNLKRAARLRQGILKKAFSGYLEIHKHGHTK